MGVIAQLCPCMVRNDWSVQSTGIMIGIEDARKS